MTLTEEQIRKVVSDLRERDEAADDILSLRAQGVHVIAVSYSGGNDEGYYEVEYALREDGKQTNYRIGKGPYGDDAIASFVVAKELGYFSGAGDGTDYGGTIEMRLDTLQTREVNTWEHQRVDTSTPDADWK